MERRLLRSVLDSLWSSTLTFKLDDSTALSGELSLRVRCLYEAWVALATDLTNVRSATLRGFCSFLAVTPLLDVVASCSSVRDYIRSFTYDEIQNLTIRDFKGHLSSIPLACSILKPVWSSVEALCYADKASRIGLVYNFQDNLVVQSWDVLNQWVSFPLKAHLPRPDLEDQALAKWLASEQRCSEVNEAVRKGQLSELIAELRPCFLRTLGSIPGIVPFRHGNGSTAEGAKDIAVKYLFFGHDGLLDKSVTSDFPLVDHPVHRTSKLTFVPKSATALRTICMEPCVLQYAQQGFMRVSYDNMQNHPCIRLKSADVNGSLALQGSLSGDLSTLDLSSASDSIAKELVRHLVLGSEWWNPTQYLRSTHTILPNGQIHRLEKWASMGNALTFPVETALFFSVVEFACRKAGLTVDRKTVGVYGDDIVCPTGLAAEVSYLLQQLGFSVNTEKSFTSQSLLFRESCGVEAFWGYNVTPLRYRGRHAQDDAELVPSLISLANSAKLYGFRRVREVTIRQLLKVTSHFPVTDEDRDSGLLSDHWGNYRNRSGVDATFRSYERARGLSDVSYRAASIDDFLYVDWLREHAYLDSQGSFLPFENDMRDGTFGHAVVTRQTNHVRRGV